MFRFYKAAKQAVRERDNAILDRDFWKERALELEKKLDTRSDLFIEREFRLVDRFLTSQVKTYAITDEVRASKQEASQADVDASDLRNYLMDKKAALVQWAAEAGHANPEESANKTFDQNHSQYVIEFEQNQNHFEQ